MAPTAARLKKGGLTWRPALHDFFAIPDRGFDDRKFVLSDMTVAVEVLHGNPAITFNGAVEWSLDFIYQFDVIWLPRDEQLLKDIIGRLETPRVTLEAGQDEVRCSFRFDGEEQLFTGPYPSEAYGLALLFLLERTSL